MIIYGFRARNKVMGQLQYPCPQCHKNSFHTIVRSRRWFTLFFIPVFPFTKRTTSRCNICGFQTAIDNKDADARLISNVAQPQVQAPPQQQLPPEYASSQQQMPYSQQPPPYPPYPQQYQAPQYPPQQ